MVSSGTSMVPKRVESIFTMVPLEMWSST
jgi:hypothetical protein